MTRRNPTRSLRTRTAAGAVIGVLALAGLGPAAARADDAPAPPAPTPAPQPAPAQTAAAPDLDPSVYANLSDDELVALAQQQGEEVIVVWDERPEKPFERDTTLRLTDKDLAGRGVATLADALQLVPEVTVRMAGRGGQNLDIRGMRKGAVRVLVDGVPLEDPFYGTFDLTTIPITDIVQVRVATSPSSPIDGPGGPGGVIEVHTRDAVGERLVVGRASGDTLPTAGASASGRGALGRDLALRLSANGTLGDPSYEVGDASIDDAQHYGGGAMRLEWRPAHQRSRRAVLDVAGYDRAYLVPPADSETAQITNIEREDGARATAGWEDERGKVQLAARAFVATQSRLARYYKDAAMGESTGFEDLTANRAGGSLLVHRPLGRAMQLIGAAHLVTEDAEVASKYATTVGRSTIAELAGGWQAALGRWNVDAAAGLAAPIGVGEHPWPEGKLAVTFAPLDAVRFTATAARKGRLPTLRERFSVDVGNADLDPEQTSFGELKVAIAPTPAFTFESAAWARRQDGLIKADRMTTKLVNLGEVDFVGVDSRVEVVPDARVSAAATWSYVMAQDDTYEDPLDNLPAHRLTAQVRARPRPSVDATVRYRWTDSRVDRNTVLPSYDEVEAEATWTPSEAWLVALRGEDLLDRRWDLHVGVPSAGRTFTVSVQGTFH